MYLTLGFAFTSFTLLCDLAVYLYKWSSIYVWYRDFTKCWLQPQACPGLNKVQTRGARPELYLYTLFIKGKFIQQVLSYSQV